MTRTTKAKANAKAKARAQAKTGAIRPSLTTLVKRALGRGGECELAKGTNVLVAVSGGPDSMALLSVLARVGRDLGLVVVAHGVDHGLRKEAAAELALAKAHATRLNIAFGQTKVLVKPGANLQARAREARWSALVTAARALLTRSAVIATAHHADDRAETFLMRLLRGAGARGLAVLPPRADAGPFSADDIPIVRPILRATREDVLLHLERHDVPFATDPSNADPHYTRTRIRKEVLPLLISLDPQIARHIEAIADELVLHQMLTDDDKAVRTDELKWASLLPRATQRAIAALVVDRNPTAKIWLPGGLVATLGADADRAGRASRNASPPDRVERGAHVRTSKKPKI